MRIKVISVLFMLAKKVARSKRGRLRGLLERGIILIKRTRHTRTIFAIHAQIIIYFMLVAAILISTIIKIAIFRIKNRHCYRAGLAHNGFNIGNSLVVIFVAICSYASAWIGWIRYKRRWHLKTNKQNKLYSFMTDRILWTFGLGFFLCLL